MTTDKHNPTFTMDNINQYIDSRVEQLQMYISDFQQQSLRAKGEHFRNLCSMIGDYNGRKMELITLQSNFRLGVYNPFKAPPKH